MTEVINYETLFTLLQQNIIKIIRQEENIEIVERRKNRFLVMPNQTLNFYLKMAYIFYPNKYCFGERKGMGKMKSE
jgi:hypothetical protein